MCVDLPFGARSTFGAETFLGGLVTQSACLSKAFRVALRLTPRNGRRFAPRRGRVA